MTGGTALDLQWPVFKDKRTLLIGVTFDAGGIGAERQPGLPGFKTAVRIMAIAAFDRPFHHLVSKRFAEL